MRCSQILNTAHSEFTKRGVETRRTEVSQISFRCRSLPRRATIYVKLTLIIFCSQDECVVVVVVVTLSRYYAVLVPHPTRTVRRHARTSVTCAPRPLLSRACTRVRARVYDARVHARTYVHTSTHRRVHALVRVKTPRARLAAPATVQRHPEYRM